MDNQIYEILKRAVSYEFRPKMHFNKRIDETHRQIDLVFIDGYYREKQERQENKRLEWAKRNANDQGHNRQNVNSQNANGQNNYKHNNHKSHSRGHKSHGHQKNSHRGHGNKQNYYTNSGRNQKQIYKGKNESTDDESDHDNNVTKKNATMSIFDMDPRIYTYNIYSQIKGHKNYQKMSQIYSSLLVEGGDESGNDESGDESGNESDDESGNDETGSENKFVYD